jgi:hypothetical protein
VAIEDASGGSIFAKKKSLSSSWQKYSLFPRRAGRTVAALTLSLPAPRP